MRKHILVVDDDKIRFLLKTLLEQEDYIVSVAANTDECQLLLKEFIFDLIIMDVMMPGESGLDFVKRKRHEITPPIIMLTALGDTDDRINGLEGGADDYLPKPFDHRELLLRVQKLISRSNQNSDQRLGFTFGNYTFDSQNGALTHHTQGLIYLTTAEKDLLKLLSSHAGQVLSREDIAKEFDNVNLRTIDTNIARLRTKFEADPKKPEFLQTVRGKGYVLYGELI
jgi:two-component system phosphate regulon response regulator OmpR